MPTNLPPDYFKIEKRYKSASSQSEKIELLEEMMTVVPKHKGTDKLRADLRKRISKLKISPQGKQNRIGLPDQQRRRRTSRCRRSAQRG